MRRTILIALCLLLAVMPAAAAQTGDDDGVWVPTLPVTPQGEVELDLFRDGSAFAHNTADGNFWYSSDGGGTWTPRQPLPNAGGTPMMTFASPRLGYSMSNGELFETTDLGVTWNPVDPPSFDVAWDDGLPVFSNLSAVAGTRKLVTVGTVSPKVDGCPRPPDETVVFYGSPGNWERTTIPFYALGWEIEFLDEDFGLVVLVEMGDSSTSSCGFSSAGVRHSVLKTTDGGRTFEEIYSVGSDVDGVMAVAMPARRTILLGLDSGRILRSTDGGRTFDEIVDLAAETGYPGLWIDEITFANRKVGYAGSNGMGTWRTADGGKTWTQETSHQAASGLNIGDLVAVGWEDALVGGPWAISRRETP